VRPTWRGALWSPLVLLAVLLLAPIASTAQTRAEVATDESRTGGAITGRVVGEDGQPLANARVSASRMGGAAGAVAAQSDGEGKFTLANLTFGAYLVNAFAPGYMLETDPSEHPSARVYHHVGDSVTLRMIKGGVITGTVTGAGGEPVVGVFIEATRVRYADGRTVREGASGRIWQPRQTDDRGVYRIYGLRPGAYIIRAGGRTSFGTFTPYDLNVPTYYPSTTRDAATEVAVPAGAEMTGIDIRYRGEAGRAVSGVISGALPADYPASGTVVIALKHVSSAAPEQYVSFLPGNSGFAFDGVADGDYDLLARLNSSRADLAAASPPRRVSVRGRDVTGITLALAPLGSVSGQLRFDPPAALDDKLACPPARAPRAAESVISARRVDAGHAADPGSAFFPAASETVPDDKGEFHLRGLKAGHYQLLVRLPAADFYVRAVTLANAPANNAPPAPAAPGKTARPAPAIGDPARLGFTLQTGERLSGLNLHVAAGAAGVRGRIAAANGGAGASAAGVALRVHLVPAEREQADNLLRYAESRVAADGAFAFAHISPGRYWLLARPAPNAPDAPDNSPLPLAWEADARARLRREAEAARAPLALAPCQRIADFVLPHPSR
jgi:hypothetical protein